jgi:hypothetical protein
MTATLIACIAAIPSLGAIRRSAGITNVENAKNTPAISPEPTNPTSAAADSSRSTK